MSTPATLFASPHDVFRDCEAAGTPTKSPARRVLGHLTPKAINVLQNNTAIEHLEALKSRSPLKKVQTMSPARQLDTENIPDLQYPGLGRKRPISEVDGAVAREDALGYTYRAFDERDGSLRQAFRPDILAKMREDASTPVVDLLGDDYSEESPDGEAQVSQETVMTVGSFSSLINYNPDGSSSQNRVPEPPQESVVTSYADKLRTRLRLAKYKVDSDQETVPFADLSLPTLATSTSPSQPSTSFKASTPTTDAPASLSTSLSSVPSITFSPARSTDLYKIPKLLPAPLLLPTAYSTRFITDAGVPSSPPASVSPSQTHILPPDLSPSHTFVTPVAQRRAFEQLSSPPESAGLDIGARVNRRFEEGDLTSSVVKGRAASGLLDLMRGD